MKNNKKIMRSFLDSNISYPLEFFGSGEALNVEALKEGFRNYPNHGHYSSPEPRQVYHISILGNALVNAVPNRFWWGP
jgi:hypothetical protein